MIPVHYIGSGGVGSRAMVGEAQRWRIGFDRRHNEKVSFSRSIFDRPYLFFKAYLTHWTLTPYRRRIWRSFEWQYPLKPKSKSFICYWAVKIGHRSGSDHPGACLEYWSYVQSTKDLKKKKSTDHWFFRRLVPESLLEHCIIKLMAEY